MVDDPSMKRVSRIFISEGVKPRVRSIVFRFSPKLSTSTPQNSDNDYCSSLSIKIFRKFARFGAACASLFLFWRLLHHAIFSAWNNRICHIRAFNDKRVSISQANVSFSIRVRTLLEEAFTNWTYSPFFVAIVALTILGVITTKINLLFEVLSATVINYGFAEALDPKEKKGGIAGDISTEWEVQFQPGCKRSKGFVLCLSKKSLFRCVR